MKKTSALFFLVCSILFSSCIETLSNRGIYETTRCYGVVMDGLTNAPLDNVRVFSTDGESVDETVYTRSDGSFEIPVRVAKLISDYYICIEADSLFQRYEIKVDKLLTGTESHDLGRICFEGAVVPTVHTVGAEDVAATTACCTGVIGHFGYSEISERGFVYGTMQYPTTDDVVARVSGVGDTFRAELSLMSHTTYYVRAYAVNKQGIGYGNQVSLTTQDGLPVVTTAPISGVMPTTAVGGGRVFGGGELPIVAKGICWSTGVNPTVANLHTDDGADTGSFVSALHGLRPGTTYNVRAYAQNAAGVSYGENLSFVTPDGLPSVVTGSVSNVTATSAEAGGSVDSDGGFPVLRRGVCYGTSPMPTTAGRHTLDGSGLGVFVSHMAHLSAATTYYVRAYATNGVGTVYGEQYVFVTE